MAKIRFKPPCPGSKPVLEHANKNLGVGDLDISFIFSSLELRGYVSIYSGALFRPMFLFD